ncbi:unnamed protein product [Peniophora sp. CBMAI 1063]|nr:unnamed protein product [Peniophora sp. CBMAI 1063]
MDHLDRYPEQRAQLVSAAIAAKQHAYDVHSQFRVGASVLSTSGEIVSGASIDNAAYGASLCAERSALAKAVSDGLRAFVALAITSDVDAPLPPCGLCRQVIREFCSPDVPILLVPAGHRPGPSRDDIVTMRVKDLLPSAQDSALSAVGRGTF